jgi:histidinol-phosphate/aromatic aminotransferase/cobyric acid decarboxylase-like protein/GNAT superfamily N-acetyltransferase
MTEVQRKRLVLALASDVERSVVYRARHEVYATELGQYTTRTDGMLPDAEGLQATYIVASVDGTIVGFVGITPPSSPSFSVDRYLPRGEIPFPFDQHLYEIRALTVLKPFRGRLTAAALMYAAFRWVEAHGGTRILAIGRREIIAMYLRAGLERVGPSFASGAVTYDLLTAEVSRLGAGLSRFESRLERLAQSVEWRLGIAFRRPPECYHGGAFFQAIGETFDQLHRKDDVINADVLDAWFPPAPVVQEVLQQHLEWIIRTSPPTRAEGLTHVIAQARQVEPNCVLVGGGSSDLIFLALRQWLTPASRVLILDPTYGEYAHVLQTLMRCHVERFPLDRDAGYRVDLDRLVRRLATAFDLFIWVNPNNPTGLHVPKHEVERVIAQIPTSTRVWIDETYVEYAGHDQSLEAMAAQSPHVLVCKSLSKVYALSGLRVGYLCSSPHQIEALRALTPPWAVSLPAQIAATYALQAPDYYAMRYRQTAALRVQLHADLKALGITEIVPGMANFLMFHLPPDGPTTATVAQYCREHGLFVRDIANMGAGLGPHAMRIAVKDAPTNQRMIAVLRDALRT